MMVANITIFDGTYPEQQDHTASSAHLTKHRRLPGIAALMRFELQKRTGQHRNRGPKDPEKRKKKAKPLNQDDKETGAITIQAIIPGN